MRRMTEEQSSFGSSRKHLTCLSSSDKEDALQSWSPVCEEHCYLHRGGLWASLHLGSSSPHMTKWPSSHLTDVDTGCCLGMCNELTIYGTFVKWKKKVNNRRGSRLICGRSYEGGMEESCRNLTCTERSRLGMDPSCVPGSTRAPLETVLWKRAGWGVGSQGRVPFSSCKSFLCGAPVSSSLKWEGLSPPWASTWCRHLGSVTSFVLCRRCGRLSNPAQRDGGDTRTHTHRHTHAGTHAPLHAHARAVESSAAPPSFGNRTTAPPGKHVPAPPAKACPWGVWTCSSPAAGFLLTSNVPLQVSNLKQWATGAFWGDY